MKPYFSIIIPSYNEEKLIGKTLEYIKKQTFRDYEIIVKDGGSKDRTVEIAKKYADKVLVGKDVSIADARNKAIKIAKGKILFFIDADTFLIDKKVLERTKQEFEKDEKLVCIEHFFVSDKSKYNWYMGIVKLFHNVLSVLGRPLVTTLCCAYRKNIVDKLGGFNTELKCTEDFD